MVGSHREGRVLPSGETEWVKIITRYQGISDGAGALVLASEEAAKNLKPLARLVGWSYVGVDPSIMGIGPVPAIENLLKVTKLTLNDIDLIEVR